MPPVPVWLRTTPIPVVETIAPLMPLPNGVVVVIDVPTLFRVRALPVVLTMVEVTSRAKLGPDTASVPVNENAPLLVSPFTNVIEPGPPLTVHTELPFVTGPVVPEHIISNAVAKLVQSAKAGVVNMNAPELATTAPSVNFMAE